MTVVVKKELLTSVLKIKYESTKCNDIQTKVYILLIIEIRYYSLLVIKDLMLTNN